MAKIEVRNVYKIFGPRPETVLPSVREGIGKAELREKTGHTIGLRDVSLSMPAGKTFVVMGLSGSGKSTLIRHLNRLIDPTAGEILVDGADILSLSQAALLDFRRHKTSMVFQRFGLLPHRTVLRNVAYGLTVQGVERAKRDMRAREWIEAVGLAGYEAAYPSQLSGGMQQRVGLARALATNPEILLMDEPFSALDPLIRRDMQDQLVALQQRLHKTIVFISHDLDEALRLGDEIAILKDGEVVQVGSPQQILLHPADAYVQAFVKDVNRGRVLTAETVMTQPDAVVLPEDSLEAILARIRRSGHDIAYVVDRDRRPQGIVTADATEAALRDRHQALNGQVQPVPTVPAGAALEDLLPLTLETRWPLAVIDEAGVMLGIVPRRTLIAALAEK